MTVTLDLSEELERRINERAGQQGVSAEGWLQAVVLRELDDAPVENEPPEDTRPIHEIIAERMKQLPEEAFEGLPLRVVARTDDVVANGLPWPADDDIRTNYQSKFTKRGEPIFSMLAERTSGDAPALDPSGRAP